MPMSNTAIAVRRSLVPAMFALGLAACGGSSGGGGSSTDDSSGADDGGSGTFSLDITDGPVTEAQEVTVEFTGVDVLKVDGDETDDGTDGADGTDATDGGDGTDGTEEATTAAEDDGSGDDAGDGEESAFRTITFDEPRSIDLLSLEGDVAENLLSDVEIEAGEYRFRLNVNAEFDGVDDSFIVLSDGTKEELRIPSGSKTGLKTTSTFTIGAGDSRDFTIDFDLRKSVTNPPGQDGALLRPTLRLIDNLETGTLAGEVEPNFVVESGEDSDTTLSSESCAGPSAYIYDAEGFDSAGDLGSTNEPLATANLKAPEEGAESSNYTYEVGFLEAGTYQVAVVCADGDDPETGGEEIPTSATSEVEVTAGETAELNFGL